MKLGNVKGCYERSFLSRPALNCAVLVRVVFYGILRPFSLLTLLQLYNTVEFSTKLSSSLGSYARVLPKGDKHKQLFFLYSVKTNFVMKLKIFKTFNNGSLGSRIDEERSEMRYVMWIAEFRESSNLWTHIAPLGIPGGMPVWASFPSQTILFGSEWYSN